MSRTATLDREVVEEARRARIRAVQERRRSGAAGLHRDRRDRRGAARLAREISRAARGLEG